MILKREPAGIQTPSLLIRSQMLYSVKLQAHSIDLLSIFRSANVKNKFTQQNNWFGPANKKANFEALYNDSRIHD